MKTQLEAIQPPLTPRISPKTRPSTVDRATASVPTPTVVGDGFDPSQGKAEAKASVKPGVARLQVKVLNSRPLPAPEAQRLNFSETIGGLKVADPYRWLEVPADKSQELIPGQALHVDKFVEAHNGRFLHAMRGQASAARLIRDRLVELYGGTQNEESLLDGAEGLLADRSAFVAALKLPASAHVISKSSSPDGDTLAIEVAHYHGDDRHEIYFLDSATGLLKDGPLVGVKWSSMMWLDESRFVYSAVQQTEAQLEANAPDIDHAQFLHVLGTKQPDDKRLFCARQKPWVHADIEQHGDWLVRSEQEVGRSLSRYFIAPYDIEAIAEDRVEFKPLFECTGLESAVGFIEGTEQFVVQTRVQPNGRETTGRVAFVDVSDPTRTLKTLVPPQPYSELETTQICDDYLLLTYQTNMSHRLMVCEHDGTVRAEIDPVKAGLPPGSAGWASIEDEAEADWDDPDQQVVRFWWSSLLHPTAQYEASIDTGEIKAVAGAVVDTAGFDVDGFVVDEMPFVSTDGTTVPMLVIRAKEDFEYTGDHPTLMYGYGGFEVDVNNWDALRKEFIPFLEAGGVVALPALRGGAELGDAWHVDGMLDDKQQVFDDFITAAETLIEKGVTSSSKLAINGASNGGLLVGAAVVQRPDLFKAAVPHAGVMDMHRFDQFSAGRWWTSEYGQPSNDDHARFLSKYSPYHQVKDGEYPATLVTTGRFDSRVDPSHSWKFAAALCHHQEGDAPIFSYTNPDSGHWPGHWAERKAEFNSLWLSFVMQQLEMSPAVPLED